MIRRSKMEVFMDIIKVAASGPIRRTHIMYRANLAWTVLKEALETLEERGILRSETKGKEIYITLTDRGFNALSRLDEVQTAFGIAMEAPREAYVAQAFA